MAVISLLLLIKTENIELFITQLSEIVIIYVIQILINKANRKISTIICGLLVFIFNIQILIYYFSNSYVTTAMLSNINYLGNLEGKLTLYIICISIILFVSFIPDNPANIKPKTSVFLLSISIIVLSICNTHSPFEAFVKTWYDYYEAYGNKYASEDEDYTAIKKIFYRPNLQDYFSDTEISNKKPNIILIFTEGLSKSIIEDRPDITPNMNNFINRSISFENYYNHTFATYRGLQGQLFSGYQRRNTDMNNLISLQSVLKEENYTTLLFYSEPNNEEFSTFVNELGFDKVITTNPEIGDLVSDKDILNILANECTEQNKNEKPYLAVLYNIGTHVNVDSPDLKYGDGKNQLLNRFYNYDYYFGEFTERILNNKSFDNTIVVLTGDHCAYYDSDFAVSFPDYKRISNITDRIPLAIYYKGVEPNAIDVNGRNSIDFAPTILDLLDINHENYFLGSSLFGKPTEYSYLFCSENNFFDTSDNTIRTIENPQIKKKVKEKINDYYLISTGEIDSSLSTNYLDIYFENNNIYIEIKPDKEYDYFNVAVWCESNQSDLIWYQVNSSDTNNKKMLISDFEQYNRQCNIHVYGVKGQDLEFIAGEYILVNSSGKTTD